MIVLPEIFNGIFDVKLKEFHQCIDETNLEDRIQTLFEFIEDHLRFYTFSHYGKLIQVLPEDSLKNRAKYILTKSIATRHNACLKEINHLQELQESPFSLRHEEIQKIILIGIEVLQQEKKKIESEQDLLFSVDPNSSKKLN